MTVSVHSPRPSLAEVESLVCAGELRAAFDLAIRILHAVDERYGRLDAVDCGDLDVGSETGIARFCDRFAACLMQLLADPALPFEGARFEAFMGYHRWTDVIFALSAFQGTDDLFGRLPHNQAGGQMTFKGDGILRVLALLSPSTAFPVDLGALWSAHAPAAAVAFLSYLSSRYVFSPRAFAFRERLLQWLPSRLNEVKLGARLLLRLPEVYMHCSYALGASKHDIKKPLMEQMRRACLEAGCAELNDVSEARLAARRRPRPTIVVAAEHLRLNHSIYRTHSRAIRALRDRFHVVGIAYPNPLGTPIADLFDECIAIPEGDFFAAIRSLAESITARTPALIFYPAVGMVPHMVALASLRLAPIQCASYGHAATTLSPVMDYMILPEDYVVSAARFSERLLCLPKEAMPFAPLAFRKPPAPSADRIVRVAIPASVMKLNPRFLEALVRIRKGAYPAVEFHFFPLAAAGLAHSFLKRAVDEHLPGAKVFEELTHATYMERLADCAFFLSPFPYGNTNGIVDTFRLGLPGVCLDGEEIHAHIDAALFARIGSPEELVANSVDGYVSAALRLINDEPWRAYCRRRIATADVDAAFFEGEAHLFADAIADLIAAGRG